ncbi:MAG: hypothetical protein RL226_1432, partial [Bacteroidota bacterium]
MAFPSTLYKAASTLVVSCLLLTGTAQVPVSSFSVTPENLINEEFCSQITLENTGNAGYQPYIRLFLPPQITASSLEVQMLGNPVTDVVTVGTFSGSTLDDPNLQEEDPNNLVSGPAGYVWLNVNLPVGSLIEGAITLDVSLCATLNGPGVTADVPLTLETQVVYRFGDTPTGANGSIAGTLMSGQVTPKLYTFGYIVDMGTVVTGGCNYLSYDLIVDIAQQKVVNGLVINAPLPASIKYYDIYGITPGCIITQEPAIGGTGTINVQCNNVVGSDQEEDVKVSFLATVADILNDNSCSEIQVSSAATVVSNQQPTPLSSATGISAMHATFLPVSPSSDVIPGNTVSLGFDLAVSEFVAGLNELTFTCILPDGLSYQNPAWLNGTPINATITANVDGTTELFFDLVAANGGDFAPCDMRTLAFEALILEQYAGGGTVAAGDPLVTLGTVTYDVAGGVDGCTVPYTMGYSVDAPSVLKEIVTAPANGQNYVPGELITYRLTAEIPSGDVNNLVFEDLFPIPVHDVSTLNLTFGTDIDWSPLDNVGITPASISIDATKNKLVVDWGTVSFPTSLSSRIVSIDITIAIASAPFADGLMHTNFGRFSFENSIAESSSDLSLTSIGIGAPLLLFTKGVLTTDQPDAAYSPVMVPINANASNLDAWDWVTYRLTLNNIGDAPAYDVIVNDFPPTPQLGNCQVLSVKNGENTNVPYSGNLFGAGLVVSSVAKYNPSNQTDQVYV